MNIRSNPDATRPAVTTGPLPASRKIFVTPDEAADVRVPRSTPAERSDAKHQAVYDRLSQLHGSSFDTAYAPAMVKGRQAARSNCSRTEARNGKDASLCSWPKQLARRSRSISIWPSSYREVAAQ